MKIYNRPTLREVAKLAKVSVPTVSRVINKEKYVSGEVKERVLNAVAKLNYEPQWNARSLRIGKTNIVGIIVPSISNYFFASVIHGVGTFFKEKKKDIILFNTDFNEEVETKAIKIAIAKRVEGLVIATISKKNLIKDYHIPTVYVDNKNNSRNVDFILHDDINGSFKLIDHLIRKHGLTKIACISGPLNESSGFDKLNGYKKALEMHNIPIIDEYIKIANWKKDLAYEATKVLLNMENKPQAIFTANTNMVIGSLRYINRKKIKVPEDISIVTFDDYDYVTAFNPPLTTLERVDIQMGELAAKILLDRINGKSYPYKTIRIDSKLIARGSCGCP